MKFWKIIIVFIILALTVVSSFGYERYCDYKQKNQIIREIQNQSDYQEDRLNRYYQFYITKSKSINDTIQLVNEDIDLIGDVNYLLVLNILNDKYYIKKNLKEYMDYFKESHYHYDLRTTIAIVNAKANNDPYSIYNSSDTSLEKLMLCNRYNGLSEDFEGIDLVNVDKKLSVLPGAKMNREAYEAFLEIVSECKKENHQIFINGKNAYRNYKEQQVAFDAYVEDEGMEVALIYAAKPGYSEHQTGYAMDIVFDFIDNDHYSYDDYQWMLDHCWDYGFIVRYPSGCEMITRNEYEPWHYRYVGKDVAQYLKDNEITFDEYYNYFIVDNSVSVEEFVEIFE